MFVHDVRKVVDLMSEMQAKSKRHILIFETQFGQVTLATDDLDEVSKQAWFAKFMDAVFDVSYQPPEEEQAPMRPASQPMQQPQQQVQRPATKPWMSVEPNQMTQEMWRKLQPDQQQEYLEYYGLGKK